MRHKERKLSLPPDFPRFLAPYLQQYTPKESLFECTARNLEYVLRDAAEKAGIADGVSFEELRMTCAVRDYRSGMPPEAVRKKLGLSVITWQDLGDKIKRLASPAL
jgi:integrase/recombinase XerD